jgi:tRNA A-37 threonylcarbamoyl transferase component Bud32
MTRSIRPPAGYQRFDEHGAIIVARNDTADAIRQILAASPAGQPTLHGCAGQIAGARSFKGRETAYAIEWPTLKAPIVVRHNRHGGALRAITGDVFMMPTRAPEELAIALRLTHLKVPTPIVLAYAVYPTAPGFGRSDVVTEEIRDSADLGELLLRTSPDSVERHRAWGATKRLLKRLASAGVRHHDLNVKNILIRSGEQTVAYVLDVDRVEFDCTRRDAYAGNRARLRRSVDKWRRTRGLMVSDAEIAFLQSGHPAADATITSS